MKSSRMKRLISSVLAMIMILGCMPLTSFAVTEYTFGDYTYTVSDSDATIVSYPETAMGSVSIPSSLNGYTVKKIGAYAFYACTNLTGVTIPNTVTEIGNYAFAYCVTLSIIEIPSSVTVIGSNAFKNSNNVTINCKKGSYAEKFASENGITTNATDDGFDIRSKDNNSFFHWDNQSTLSGFFGVDNYHIRDDLLWAKLVSIAFSNDSDLSAVFEHRDDPWEGSCYGIATVLGMAYLGYNSINDMSSISASSFFEMCPFGGHLVTSNPKLLDAIEFYYLLQWCDSTYGSSSRIAHSTFFNWAAKLGHWLKYNENIHTNDNFWKLLFQKVKDEYTVLLRFGEVEGGGHAVITCGGETLEDGTNRIKIYDENSLGDNPENARWGLFHFIDIKPDGSVYYNDGSQTIKIKDYMTDVSYISFRDLPSLKASDYSMKKKQSTVSVSSSNSTVIVSVSDNKVFRLTDSNGKYLSVNADTVDCTMNIYNVQRIIEDHNSVVQIEVDRADSFFFETTGLMYFSIRDNNAYYSVRGTDLQKATINIKNGLALDGRTYDFSATCNRNTDGTNEIVKYTGTGNGHTTISRTEDNAIALSSEHEVCGLSAKIIDANEDTIIVEKHNTDEYIVKERGSQWLKVTIPKSLSCKYKGSVTIDPVIEPNITNYAVAFETDNPKVVSVDDNGNVKALKKGNATITVTITDQYGNIAKDTCTVTVKYTFIQWIIKILLFGWIWY